MRMPPLVLGLLAVDLALTLVYLVNHAVGGPFNAFTNFVDLDGEAALLAWYSAIQWFCAAELFWLFAERRVVRGLNRSWLLALLPGIFLAFSLDEVAQIHEWLGRLTNLVLPSGDTMFSTTGVWPLVIGVPFALLFVALIVLLRPYHALFPRAFGLLVTGMALLLTGAAGVELLANLVPQGSLPGVIQVAIEESAELIGATIIVWSGCELLRGQGPPVSASLASGPFRT